MLALLKEVQLVSVMETSELSQLQIHLADVRVAMTILIQILFKVKVNRVVNLIAHPWFMIDVMEILRLVIFMEIVLISLIALQHVMVVKVTDLKHLEFVLAKANKL